ncbi:hypothetical protein ATKI12_6798 [Kitasatospora sp. Ki12]
MRTDDTDGWFGLPGLLRPPPNLPVASPRPPRGLPAPRTGVSGPPAARQQPVSGASTARQSGPRPGRTGGSWTSLQVRRPSRR